MPRLITRRVISLAENDNFWGLKAASKAKKQAFLAHKTAISMGV